MYNVINRVLSSSITKRIEIAEGGIRAGVDSKADLRNLVIGIWRCLCTTDRARVCGVAHSELVVILGVGLQSCGFDLYSVSLERLTNSSYPL